MELVEEVLASQKRIRLVLAARATPKAELLAAAAVRAVDNGREVLYIGPTDHSTSYDKYVVFPPNWSATNEGHGITFTNFDLLGNNLEFKDYGAYFASGMITRLKPDLIVMRDPYIRHKSGYLVRQVIVEMMRRNAARLLIATLPITQVGKPLAASRIYRLWRQADIFDDIDIWHWPSPPSYRALFGHYFPPPMFDSELGAKWVSS